ncbi:hypothetical protein D918_08980 [Trichuris suis]|nr:hypothetical protein D918_08980 [Trichuris suis]
MNRPLSKITACLIVTISLAQAYIVGGLRAQDGIAEFGQRGLALPGAAYPSDNGIRQIANSIGCIPLDDISYWLCKGPPYNQASMEQKFQQTSKRRNPSSFIQFGRERAREDRPIIRLG